MTSTLNVSKIEPLSGSGTIHVGSDSSNTVSINTTTQDVTLANDLIVTGNTTITGATTISGNIIPGSANTYTLGTSSAAFASAYMGSGVYIGGTTSSNLLDDYEEGTWTPSIGGTATYNTQTGFYTKVGNLVLCIYDININVIGTGSTSIMTGFPFTAANLTSGPVSYYSGIATSVYSLDSYIINGSTNMYYTGHTTASGNIGNNLTVFQNSARIVGAVTYRV